MERLTERWSDSTVKLKGCSNVYANVERKRAHIQNAIVRLAAYEDSGMMPDEISVLVNVVRCKDCKYHYDIMEESCVVCKKYAFHECFKNPNDFCSYGEMKEE